MTKFKLIPLAHHDIDIDIDNCSVDKNYSFVRSCSAGVFVLLPWNKTVNIFKSM